MMPERKIFKSMENNYIQKNWKVTNNEIRKYVYLLQNKYKLKEIQLLEPKNNINEQFLLCWITIDPSKLGINKDRLVKVLEKNLTADVKIGINSLIYVRFFSPGILLKTFDLIYQVKNQKVLA